MKDLRASPLKTALVAICLMLAIGLTCCSDANLSALALKSHQPATFQQMRALVTPADPDVRSALDEALSTPAKTIMGKSEAATSFDSIRNWVSASIEYVSDEKSQGVEDYWQLPSETLALGSGDCEDFAILLVSMLRAHGVTDDQAYVSVGYDINNLWHAYVVERCYDGIWRILAVENAGDASYLDSFNGPMYNIAYCFNDKQSFQGLPEYPPGYVVPEITASPTPPAYIRVRIKGTTSTQLIEGDMNLINPSLDDAKKRMGKLFLPSYIPPGYSFDNLLVNGNWSMWLNYHKSGSGAILEIIETPSGVDIGCSPGSLEEVIVNGSKAYLVHGSYYKASPTATLEWREDRQVNLYFSLDGWVIHILAMQPASWTTGDLIKIAESLQVY